MRNLIIAAVVIVILALGYFFLMKGKGTSTPSNSQTANACDKAPTVTRALTITYSSSGFSPALVSITSGGSLTVKNTSGKDLSFNSNPHPVHTDDTDLNIGAIGSGAEKTITVTKTGCFGYHNHLSPNEGGKILIK